MSASTTEARQGTSGYAGNASRQARHPASSSYCAARRRPELPKHDTPPPGMLATFKGIVKILIARAAVAVDRNRARRRFSVRLCPIAVHNPSSPACR